MGVAFIKEMFGLASERSGPSMADPAALGLRSDRVLNYVWINSKPVPEPGMDEPLSAVPLHYLDKAFDNARAYPDTMVNLWLDYRLLNKASRFMVESHAYFAAPSNVRLCDINTIPAYRNEPFFRSDEEGRMGVQMWWRVDLARFMALEHCLAATKAKEVFYADFDVEDVALDNIVTKNVLKKKGMVFGGIAYEDITRQRYYHENERIPRSLTHAYIVIDRAAHDELKDDLLPVLTGGLRRNQKVSVIAGLSFSLLCRDLGRSKAEHYSHNFHANEVYETYMTDVAVPPWQAVLPRPALYEELALCGLTFRGG